MEVSPANRDVRPSAFAKLYYFMRPDRGRMVCSLVLACIGEAVGMVPYVVIALLAAGLIEGTLTFERAALLAAVAALAHVARFFCTWRSSMMSHRIAFKALATMRDQMAEKMERVPMGTIIDTPTGTFKNRFVDNVNQLEDAIAHFMPELPSNVFGPLLAMVIVFALDWRMGLAGLATIPLGVLFYAAMMRDYKPKMARYIGSEQRMNSSLVEYVNGIQVIKAFNQGSNSYQKYANAVRSFKDFTLGWFKATWVSMNLAFSILPTTLLGVLPVGLALYLAGDVTPAELGLEFVLALAVVAPLMKLSSFLNEAKAMEYAVADASEFLDLPELPEPAQRAAVRDEGVELANVSFSYESGEEVLHDVSLRVPRGSFCALVGPSGSGKSTLARLIARHWDVGAGAVRVGGVDVRDMPLDQLSQLVSFVAQDNYLFDCSLRENIRMGKPDATDDEVLAAARAACCDDFIGRLPHGYDTPAGEAGHALSGGERQRISIARAILKDAPIVVLDEATAFTDPENEERIQQSIARLPRGKTLLVIAHRLSTVAAADDIAVVDHGRIVAHGTHDRLLAACPLYASMWQAHVCAKAWSAVSRKEALDA